MLYDTAVRHNSDAAVIFSPYSFLCRHQSNGAVISRCGQPEVSWWGWRNADDEHLVQSVAKACASDSRSNSNKLINGNCSRDFSNGGDLSDVEFGELTSPTISEMDRALYISVISCVYYIKCVGTNISVDCA